MTQRIIIYRGTEIIEVDIPKKWNTASKIEYYLHNHYPMWDDWGW